MITKDSKLKVLYRELRDLKELYSYYKDTYNIEGIEEIDFKIDTLNKEINKIKKEKNEKINS